MIKLNDKYHKKVTDGIKKQTIRLGRRDIPLGENTLVFESSPNINIIVTGITYKWYGNIDNKDAQLDGFKNKRELGDELELYYPRQIRETSEMTLIKFIVVDED